MSTRAACSLEELTFQILGTKRTRVRRGRRRPGVGHSCREAVPVGWPGPGCFSFRERELGWAGPGRVSSRTTCWATLERHSRHPEEVNGLRSHVCRSRQYKEIYHVLILTVKLKSLIISAWILKKSIFSHWMYEKVSKHFAAIKHLWPNLPKKKKKQQQQQGWNWGVQVAKNCSQDDCEPLFQ